MKHSLVKEIKNRFVFIYIITFIIIFTAANLQYISLVEREVQSYIQEVYEHDLYQGQQYFVYEKQPPLISKPDIVFYSLIGEKIPVYPIIQKHTYKLSFEPVYEYYAFIFRPIIAMSTILFLIYLILNRILKRAIKRLRHYKMFLYEYFDNGKIDDERFKLLGVREDEIFEMAIQAKSLIMQNKKILRKQERFLKTLEELHDIILELSNDFNILEANKPWSEVSFLSKNFLDYLKPQNIKMLCLEARDLKNKILEHIVFVDSLGMKDRFFEVKVIYLEEGYGVIIRDVTQSYKQQREFEYLAMYDPLTDVPNRSLFLDRLKSEISKSRRYKRKFAVLFFDLNKFKDVNDIYGHEAGNLLLIEFAKRVSEVLRKSDTFARLGGDEFIAVISDLQNEAKIKKIVEKIDRKLEEKLLYEGNEIQMSTSIGVSCYPKDAEDADTLIHKADKAMYVSKKLQLSYSVYQEEA